MHLDDEQKRILDGGKGKNLQAALTDLFKYGRAMGADRFIRITSAHTSFMPMARMAACFPRAGSN